MRENRDWKLIRLFDRKNHSIIVILLSEVSRVFIKSARTGVYSLVDNWGEKKMTIFGFCQITNSRKNRIIFISKYTQYENVWSTRATRVGEAISRERTRSAAYNRIILVPTISNRIGNITIFVHLREKKKKALQFIFLYWSNTLDYARGCSQKCFVTPESRRA